MRVLHMFTNPHLTNGATVFEYRVSEYLKTNEIYFDYLVTEQATDEEVDRYNKVGSTLHKLPIDNAHGLLIREVKINYQYYKFFKTHDYKIVYADTENALRSIHLLMARLAGIPIRVVHSHNTGLQSQSKVSRCISRVLRSIFKFSATDYFSCSDLAAEWLFPKRVYETHAYTLLKNGVDLEQFRFDERVRQEMRKKLDYGDNLVIGNVGRFMPQKNHIFLLEIFERVLKINPAARLLLIGDGALRAECEEYVGKLGIRREVIFVGNVKNVNKYMQAMDIFLMPSLFEGLPITGIEAQATGLTCVFSDAITKELAITNYAYYYSIKENVNEWAEFIGKMKIEKNRMVDDVIIDAGYSIDATVDFLRKFYINTSEV